MMCRLVLVGLPPIAPKIGFLFANTKLIVMLRVIKRGSERTKDIIY